jgi:hypothetical protein
MAREKPRVNLWGGSENGHLGNLRGLVAAWSYLRANCVHLNTIDRKAKLFTSPDRIDPATASAVVGVAAGASHAKVLPTDQGTPSTVIWKRISRITPPRHFLKIGTSRNPPIQGHPLLSSDYPYVRKWVVSLSFSGFAHASQSYRHLRHRVFHAPGVAGHRDLSRAFQNRHVAVDRGPRHIHRGSDFTWRGGTSLPEQHNYFLCIRRTRIRCTFTR